MITTKVFRVQSDVLTRCHCGHEIKVDEKYFVIRTSVPKWVSLCVNCVHMLNQPIKVDMRQLKKMWAWEAKEIVHNYQIKPEVVKHKKMVEKEKKDLKVAEWV